MNLIGSRATFIANICALFVAALVVVEGAYIVHECLGYYRPQDIWAFFTPAVVMFIIRNRNFSFAILTLYLALAAQMLQQARSIHVEPHACGGRLDDPLELLGPFFLLGVICLAIYAVAALACLAAKYSSGKG